MGDCIGWKVTRVFFNLFTYFVCDARLSLSTSFFKLIVCDIQLFVIFFG